MALIVEDGTVVSNANSYVSVTDANLYLADRGITVTVSEGQILRGADYVNSFRTRFKGFKLTPIASSMQWPRSYVVLDERLLPDGTIPALIIDAQIEVALEIASNRDPHETTSTRVIKKQKLDVLEVEYDTMAGREVPNYDYRRVKSLLRPVLRNDWATVSR